MLSALVRCKEDKVSCRIGHADAQQGAAVARKQRHDALQQCRQIRADVAACGSGGRSPSTYMFIVLVQHHHQDEAEKKSEQSQQVKLPYAPVSSEDNQISRTRGSATACATHCSARCSMSVC